MARGVALWAGALSDFSPGTRAAFLWSPHPESVALDLAIQAAGLVSVPVVSSRPEAGTWVQESALPSWENAGTVSLPDRSVGGVMVDGGIVLSQEDLLNAAERIQRAVGSKGREIVVVGRAPESRPDRELLAWATVHGAAVLLAPTPESLMGSAVWARPTLFYGNAAEIAAFRRAVEQEKPPFWDRRAHRLPFGRLRTVLWSGAKEPEEDDLRFWEGRGVRLLPLTV